MTGDGDTTTLTRWFSDGEGPLAQCLAWVDDAAAAGGRQFVVFAHEVAVPGNEAVVVRSYEAVDADEGLWLWCQTPQPRGRHAHEVIRAGPVRLFADVDVHGDDPFRDRAAEATDRLVRALCETAAKQWQVACSAAVLDATVPGGKFSRHLIVSMTASDGSERAFCSARACGEFVAKVQAGCGGLDQCLAGGKPLCDGGVYRANGTLRTFGSTKLGQKRPLRLLDKPLPADGRLSETVLRRTLVSLLPRNVACVPFGSAIAVAAGGGGGGMGTAAAVTLRVLGKRQPEFAGGQDGDGEGLPLQPFLASVREHMPDVAAAGIGPVEVTSIGWIRVRCYSRECARKRAAHRTNRIYYEIDASGDGRQVYRQNCFSEACRRLPKLPWLQLPPAVAREARNLAKLAQPRTTSKYGSLLAQTMRPAAARSK